MLYKYFVYIILNIYFNIYFLSEKWPFNKLLRTNTLMTMNRKIKLKYSERWGGVGWKHQIGIRIKSLFHTEFSY